MQGCLQLPVFRPEGVVHERPRRAHDDRGVTLPLVAVRLEPVSSAKRGKQPPLPLIRHRELRLRQRLGFEGDLERLTNALDRGRGSLAFAGGYGSLEQRGDLAQFFAELVFGGHGFNDVG